MNLNDDSNEDQEHGTKELQMTVQQKQNQQQSNINPEDDNFDIDIEQAKQKFDRDFEQKQQQQQPKQQKLRPIPPRIIFTVTTLFVTGCILWGVALSDALGEGITHTEMDLSFIIMGSLLLIPGIFYGIKLIQIAFSNDNDMRDEILSEFPLEPDEAYY